MKVENRIQNLLIALAKSKNLHIIEQQSSLKYFKFTAVHLCCVVLCCIGCVCVYVFLCAYVRARSYPRCVSSSNKPIHAPQIHKINFGEWNQSRTVNSIIVNKTTTAPQYCNSISQHWGNIESHRITIHTSLHTLRTIFIAQTMAWHCMSWKSIVWSSICLMILANICK